MKRIALVVLIFLFIQNSQAQEFLLGVKGGFQGYSTRFTDKLVRDDFSSKLQLGYLGGGVIVFPLPDKFSFVFETVYSKKGRRVLYDSDKMINKSRYNFLESSWMIRKSYRIGFYEFPAEWYFNIGGNFSYWLGGSGTVLKRPTFEEPGRGAPLHYDIVFTDSAESIIENMYMVNVNRLMFGIDAGVGFTTHILGNQRFFAEMRFTYGHTQLGKSNTDTSHSSLAVLIFDDDIRNVYRTVSFTMGYAYAFDVKNLRKGKSTVDKKIKSKGKRRP